MPIPSHAMPRQTMQRVERKKVLEITKKCPLKVKKEVRNQGGYKPLQAPVPMYV